MADWVKTRLVVQVDDEDITPIESFTPSFNLNTEVLHSIEATHVGYIANPASINFSMTVRAIGSASATLTALALEGTEFKIALMKASDSAPDEWDFEKIVLERCIITSANPSNASISGAPVASFSGVALEASAKTDSEYSIPDFS